MSNVAFITISGKDRLGLVAEVAARLFDLGGDLGDTTFAVLGTGFEFSSVVEFPDQTNLDDIGRELCALPCMADTDFRIEPFRFDVAHDESGRISHRIRISGGDQPGLIARLSEVFVGFNANVVRLNCERVPDQGGQPRFITRFAVAIPPERVTACLAAIGNTAGQLEMSCTWDEAWENRNS
jgi:glycine cleavage system transcriptional repressor